MIDDKKARELLGVSIEDCHRLALRPDLSVDTKDPRNARYLVPLPDADDEEAAHETAKWMFEAPYDDGSGVKYNENTYYQCLVDGRRMRLDEEYANIFEGAWMNEARAILGLPPIKAN